MCTRLLQNTPLHDAATYFSPSLIPSSAFIRIKIEGKSYIYSLIANQINLSLSKQVILMAETRTAEPESRIKASYTLQDFIGSRNPKMLLNDCDPEAMRTVFLQILDGYHRTPAADQKLAEKFSIPSDDRYSGHYTGSGEYNMGEVLGPSGEILPIRQVVKENGEVDIFADPHMVKYYFKTQWSWNKMKRKRIPDTQTSKPVEPETQTSKPVEWNDLMLYTTSKTPGYKFSDYPKPEGAVDCRLWELTTSQLLLYRLVVVFGMPPQQELDPHKQVWSVTLYWGDNKESWFELEDWKGYPIVSFKGCEEASNSALRLFEWLISDNVAHPYGYFLAGNHA